MNTDISKIINTIQQKSQSNKQSDQFILDFIYEQLSGYSANNIGDTLPLILEHVQFNYLSKETATQLISDKLNNENKSPTTFADTPSSNNSFFAYMKPMIKKLEKNRNLNDIPDSTLHFSKKHKSLINRIFYLQITQNYLSALKWFILSDVVSQQSNFNLATEDSLKHVLNLISDLNKRFTISITELQNYAKASEKWIQNNEANLVKLQEDLSSTFVTKAELSDFLTKHEIKNLVKHEISDFPTKNDLDKLKIQTKISQANNDELLEKIQNMENMYKQFAIVSHELQNYAKASEKWIQNNEAKLVKLQEDMSSSFATKDELSSFATKDELSSFATKDVWLKYVTENNVSIDDLSVRLDKIEKKLSDLEK